MQQFLDDLDRVLAADSDFQLPSTFLVDLDVAYANVLQSETRVSTTDLIELGHTLKELRDRRRRELSSLLAKVPADDPIHCPVSLFGTMGYGRLETAHTRTLAWLLNPAGEHGFKGRLLEAFLKYVLREQASHFCITHVDRVQSECGIESAADELTAGRLDILATGRCKLDGSDESWRLVIEAKIDADEGEEQLTRYYSFVYAVGEVSQDMRVLLTPDRRKPQTGDEHDWQSISFSELAEIFGNALPDLRETPGYHFLRFYLAGVLRDVCGVCIDATTDSADPYAAVEYLRSTRRARIGGPEHGERREVSAVLPQLSGRDEPAV